MSATASPPWSGRLAFGPWWFLYAGPVGPTDEHAHHAVQITALAATSASIVQRETMHPTSLTVVRADEPHRIGGCGDGQILFVDPESDAGRWLNTMTTSTPPVHASTSVVQLPGSWLDAVLVADGLLERAGVPAGAGTPPHASEHPAVRRALELLPDITETSPAAMASLAHAVGLSASRLSHLFSAEVGVPIRHYLRWLRLLRAAECLAAGDSITAAAHLGGFADGPHFTRTFKAMFGLTPSDATGLGTWLNPDR